MVATEAWYFACLLLLVALPLLACWRWGLLAALAVAVAELGAVFLIAFQSIPPPPPRGPIPQKDVLEHLRKVDAEGFAHGLVWLAIWVIPSIAALLGGALSLVWSGVRAVRRSAANRAM